MKKKFLSAVLCGVMALTMVVPVGASQAKLQSGVKAKIEKQSKKIKAVDTKVSKKNIKKIESKAAVSANAKTFTTSSNGTIIFDYSLTGEGSLVIADAAGNAIGMQAGTSGTYYYPNLAKGTYYVLGYSDGAVAPEVASFTITKFISSENGNINGTIKEVAGTGYNNFQYFNVSKRSLVVIGAASTLYEDINSHPGVPVYIQKKNANGTYTTVSDVKYASDSNNYELDYALSKGSYRLVAKSDSTSFMYLQCSQKAYTGKYATKKSKSKSVSRKKSKYNVLTASDKKNTSHWYKLNVSKKRSSRIDVYSYNSSGQVKVTLYRGSKKISSRTAYSPADIYFKGTFTKGTYYVKVTKNTSRTSAMYRVKYTK